MASPSSDVSDGDNVGEQGRLWSDYGGHRVCLKPSRACIISLHRSCRREVEMNLRNWWRLVREMVTKSLHFFYTTWFMLPVKKWKCQKSYVYIRWFHVMSQKENNGTMDSVIWKVGFPVLKRVAVSFIFAQPTLSWIDFMRNSA